MEKPHIQGFQSLDAGVNLSINWIVIVDTVPWILQGCSIADVVNQTFVVTMYVDGTSSTGYKGVVPGVLEEEAQDGVDPIGFHQA